MGDSVEYDPVSVAAVLAEMKDTAELLVDLAYSAVLLESEAIAEEVLDLEEQMDLLELQGRMSLMLAARSPDEAETLAPVLGVVGAAEKISDAAGDIAKVVHDEVGLPPAMRAALPAAVEKLVRARIADDSTYAGRTLGEITLETEAGVRVIALRRDGDWVLNPDGATRIEADDVVLLRGSEAGVRDVYTAATGGTYASPPAQEPASDDLQRALDALVVMKDMSELAVDLAYSAVLFDSEEIAEEVLALEAEVDALQSRFEAWTLRAAAPVEDPVSLRGLVHIGAATEVISDAALEIAEGVLRGLGPHPVVNAAVEESDEVLVRLTVAAGSGLDGATVGDGTAENPGMRIVAIRPEQPDGAEDWLVSPAPDARLTAGDVLVAKGTRAGADRLRALASA